MPLFRLQLIMVATADRNDGIHDAIANNYAGALEPWKKIYESTFAARGFQLRKGITMDQFANMLAAITEGFAVHHLGDPGAGIVGDDPGGQPGRHGRAGDPEQLPRTRAEPSGLTLAFEQFESVSRYAGRVLPTARTETTAETDMTSTTGRHHESAAAPQATLLVGATRRPDHAPAVQRVDVHPHELADADRAGGTAAARTGRCR